ncbi:MAG: hypothetical protein REI12_02960 [Pedobacter sp.]|nr:hypothetical protein [Pedobacter sp.]
MKYLRWLPLVLVLIAAWNMNLRPRVINLDEELDIQDPAVSVATQGHSEAWGGIDLWAYPGLEYWRVLKRLQQAGFECSVPQDPARGGQPQSGQHTVHCNLEKSWPLQRQQTLELRVNYDLPGAGGRLQAVQAASVVSPAAWREKMAGLLRGLHLLEPATLEVRGLEAPSSDDLARIVADTLMNASWTELCGGNTRMSCNSMLEKRRKEGFPALPSEAWRVGSINELRFRLADMGFASSGRTVDRDRFLPVRVEAGRMWLDMERMDLAGQRETLAIAMDPVGARPVQIQLKGRSGLREFPLTGKATTYNDNHEQWLFPLMAGAFVSDKDELENSGGRKALWLYPQDMDETGDNLQRFSANLAFVDPAFQPQLLQAYIDFLRRDDSAEAQLKLQPPLQTADRMAAALQRSTVGALLPAADADALIAEKYRGADSAIVRAAWALYRCELGSELQEIDAVCWTHFTQSDNAASQLLQQDLQTQLRIYASLDADNPVQRRLQRLAVAYSRSASRP